MIKLKDILNENKVQPKTLITEKFAAGKLRALTNHWQGLESQFFMWGAKLGIEWDKITDSEIETNAKPNEANAHNRNTNAQRTTRRQNKRNQRNTNAKPTKYQQRKRNQRKTNGTKRTRNKTNDANATHNATPKETIATQPQTHQPTHTRIKTNETNANDHVDFWFPYPSTPNQHETKAKLKRQTTPKENNSTQRAPQNNNVD